MGLISSVIGALRVMPTIRMGFKVAAQVGPMTMVVLTRNELRGNGQSVIAWVVTRAMRIMTMLLLL